MQAICAFLAPLLLRLADGVLPLPIIEDVSAAGDERIEESLGLVDLAERGMYAGKPALGFFLPFFPSLFFVRQHAFIHGCPGTAFR